MTEINTLRLILLELTQGQLELFLSDIHALENDLNLTVKGGFVTERVRRAIRMKVRKMRDVDISQHAWFTYWLIVIKDENIAAGMLGFKGYPNAEGSTEIGYGIDPAYQNKGYMSEAVQALVDWAFTHPFCNIITATDVENPASKRLLEKLGAVQTEDNERFTSWKIQKY
jgi:RimJ/RimL family protein N-acetyltransferase